MLCKAIMDTKDKLECKVIQFTFKSKAPLFLLHLYFFVIVPPLWFANKDNKRGREREKKNNRVREEKKEKGQTLI